MNIIKFKMWIHAIRLRTLPLSVAGVLMGSILSAYHGIFNTVVFTIAMITTLLLQILSNLANDYGDFKNGVDNENRVGPERAVQSGIITEKEMKKALIILTFIILISGLSLLYSALKMEIWFLIFFITGVLAVLAALKYTIGESNYGYHGYGDIMVFIFFGLVSVMGTFFLHTGTMNITVILPSVSVGLLSAGVLNINNMRDVENDRLTGKITLAVRLGEKSKIYHLLLIASSVICFYCYLFHYGEIEAAQVIAIPSFLLLIHMLIVFKTVEPEKLDPQLKFLSLSTLLIVALSGVILI